MKRWPIPLFMFLVFLMLPNQSHATTTVLTAGVVAAQALSPHGTDVFQFWGNDTTTSNCGGGNSCLNAVSFYSSKPFIPTTAKFQLQTVGSVTADFQVGIWDSTTQITRTALPAGSGYWDSNKWIGVLTSTVSSASITGSFTTLSFTFTNAPKFSNSEWHLGLFVRDNSTAFTIGTAGFREKFAIGVGVGAGGDSSCDCQEEVWSSGAGWSNSGNGDVPLFELDGNFVSSTGGGYVGCDPYCPVSTTSAVASSWITWPGILLPAALLAGAGTLAFRAGRRTRH